MDKFTQFNDVGEVDVVASTNAYIAALTQWKAENETPTEQIENAVETVLDRQTGKIRMPMLINSAVNELSTDPAAFKALTKRVQAYVKGQKNIGRLTVTNGVGGGVARVARPGQPIPAVVKSA